MMTHLFAEQIAIDFTPIADFVGMLDYAALFLIALWGAYCCIVVWRRIANLQFSGEEEQDAFLDEVQNLAEAEKWDELTELCEDDPRGIPQLTLLAVKHRRLSPAKLKALLVERFQRDISAELDYRNNWVQTIIKAAPMLGLFGTVLGMMGAFSKLSAATEVSPDKLASDIMLALITTALGLSIAIPLVLATASISIRMSRLEDYVGSGLTRIFEIFAAKRF